MNKDINKDEILNKTKSYVLEMLSGVDAGHNFSHTERVLKNTRLINEKEKADSFLVEMGALLHDVTDEKLFNKKEAENKLNVFLIRIGLHQSMIDALFDLISSVSFGNEFDKTIILSNEQKVVRDADRLDAIGAIGIARTFHYGGSKNREIYNKNILPQTYSSQDEYRNSSAPTINHFYEKLLLLKDRMETQEGKRLAGERHDFMLYFLKQFYEEVGE